MCGNKPILPSCPPLPFPRSLRFLEWKIQIFGTSLLGTKCGDTLPDLAPVILPLYVASRRAPRLPSPPTPTPRARLVLVLVLVLVQVSAAVAAPAPLYEKS